MSRSAANWSRLSRALKLRVSLAVAWIPASTLIILMTSAQGDPLATPLRLLRIVASLTAWTVIAVVAVRLLRRH